MSAVSCCQDACDISTTTRLFEHDLAKIMLLFVTKRRELKEGIRIFFSDFCRKEDFCRACLRVSET